MADMIDGGMISMVSISNTKYTRQESGRISIYNVRFSLVEYPTLRPRQVYL